MTLQTNLCELGQIAKNNIVPPYSKVHSVVVWHARPSQKYGPEAEKGRDGLAAIAISSHLFDQSNAFDQNLVRDIHDLQSEHYLISN